MRLSTSTLTVDLFDDRLVGRIPQHLLYWSAGIFSISARVTEIIGAAIAALFVVDELASFRPDDTFT